MTLEVDIMAINKNPFMVTTSRNIKFVTSEIIHDKTKKYDYDIYNTSPPNISCMGVLVCNILADGTFECIGDGIAEMAIALKVT